MKKIVLLFGSVILLASCGDLGESSEQFSSESSVSTQSIVTESIPESKSSESTSERNEDKLFVDNGPLTEVGQWTTDEFFGDLTLEKIKKINQSFELAPGIKATITDIKLFRINNFTPRFESEVKAFNLEDNEILYSLQISPIFENNTDQGIQSISFDRLIDSEGYQHDTNLNAYYVNDLTSHAKTDKIGSHFILSNKDIINFTIYTKNLTDYDGYRIESNSVELSF